VRRISKFLPVLLASAGATAVGYGGYGAGVSQMAGAGWLQWLQVAGLFSAGTALLAAALTLLRRATMTSGSFAAEIALLERLVPTVKRHRDGVAALQDLIEVVFEAHLQAGGTAAPAALVERRLQGGRDHV
jgi:hypothetical protein